MEIEEFNLNSSEGNNRYKACSKLKQHPPHISFLILSEVLRGIFKESY